MPYEIFPERDGRILRVTYTGRIKFAERRAAAARALERAGPDGIHRFLLDYRQATCLVADEESSHAMARYLADHLDHRRARVAWLVTHDHQLCASVEDLTRGFGVASQRFRDLDAAFAWLEQADAPEPTALPAALPQASEKMGSPSASAFPPRRALALAMEASDPQLPMPPVQFAAIAQLAQELLDAGLEDATVLHLAKRMFEVVRSVPPGR